MIVKCLYRRNLKMTPGKLAAQVAHAVIPLSLEFGTVCDRIIVLEASNKKFDEQIELLRKEDAYYHVQVDAGFTELEKGTPTVVAWIKRT